MSRNPLTMRSDKLAAEAAQLMQARRITCVLAVDDDNRLVGAIHTHDLLRAGVI